VCCKPQVALERLKSSSDLDARTASQFTPLHWAATLGHLQVTYLDANKLRIGALGISGGRSLTRPFRDARRFASTGLYPVPAPVRDRIWSGTTRTPLGFGILLSFKGQFPSPRAEP
jgi:hypothetical protein